MDNQLAMSKSFQEKMYDRIKDLIGELMPQEDLKRLVDAAVQKAFFEPVKVFDGYREIHKDPYIVQQIRELLNKDVRAAVDEWLAANPDQVTKAINECIAKGFYRIVNEHIENKISGAMFNFAEELKRIGVLQR